MGARKRRGRVAKVVIALLAVTVLATVAIIVATVATGYDRNAEKPAAKPAESTDPVDMGVLAATGCIAGNSTSIDAMLKAQEEAGHDATGAAEFAAAFVRYGYRYPAPPSEDAEAFLPILAPSAAGTFSDLERGPEALRDLAPEGTPIVISTLNGSAYVAPYETDPNRAVVTVGYQYEVDGALLTTMGTAGTYELTWDGSRWQLVRALDQQFDFNELAKVGTAFSRGC